MATKHFRRRKVSECDDVCAFYLKPHDGRSPRLPGPAIHSTTRPSGGTNRWCAALFAVDSPIACQHYASPSKKEKAPADKPGAQGGPSFLAMR